VQGPNSNNHWRTPGGAGQECMQAGPNPRFAGFGAASFVRPPPGGRTVENQCVTLSIPAQNSRDSGGQPRRRWRLFASLLPKRMLASGQQRS